MVPQPPPMGREGSHMDMNGQPGSPGSGGESVPSPKRQRVENGMNGQPMAMARGQMQGMGQVGRRFQLIDSC